MHIKKKNTFISFLYGSISIFLIMALSACSFGAVSGQKNMDKSVSRSDLMLDTVVTLTLFGTEDETLINGCFDLCRKYELIFSRTDERSELYRLNHSESMEVSDELLELITLALHWCEVSDGAFDITLGEISDEYGFTSDSPSVPEASWLENALTHVGWQNIEISGHTVTRLDPELVIDLGAIAKGYIADRLASYLTESGQNSAIIDLGGNIRCVGEKPDGSAFSVGIQFPFEDYSKYIAAVSVRDCSVVTSGIYERSFESGGRFYHHILDPRTGYPYDNGLLAVSIVSPLSVDGDALSTVCFALGLEKGLELIESLDGIEAVFVTSDLEMHPSSGFDDMMI